MRLRSTWPWIAACNGFIDGVQDDSRVDFPVAFQNPEDNRFAPGPAPFFPTNTARAER